MKPVRVLCFILPIVVAGFAQSPSTVAGEYVEVRSNHLYTCACLFSGEQAIGGTEAILAWEIREGSFHGTPLAGVKVAAVIVGEGNLGMDGVARKSVLYLDQGSGRAGQVVLEWLREWHGKVFGEVLAVHSAPIVFQRAPERVRVSVGELLSVALRKARLPEDAHQGSSLWYGPFFPVAEPVLAATENTRYWGEDFRHRWWNDAPGITGYYGSFAL